MEEDLPFPSLLDLLQVLQLKSQKDRKNGLFEIQKFGKCGKRFSFSPNSVELMNEALKEFASKVLCDLFIQIM